MEESEKFDALLSAMVKGEAPSAQKKAPERQDDKKPVEKPE